MYLHCFVILYVFFFFLLLMLLAVCASASSFLSSFSPSLLPSAPFYQFIYFDFTFGFGKFNYYF